MLVDLRQFINAFPITIESLPEIDLLLGDKLTGISYQNKKLDITVGGLTYFHDDAIVITTDGFFRVPIWFYNLYLEGVPQSA